MMSPKGVIGGFFFVISSANGYSRRSSGRTWRSTASEDVEDWARALLGRGGEGGSSSSCGRRCWAGAGRAGGGTCTGGRTKTRRTPTMGVAASAEEAAAEDGGGRERSGREGRECERGTSGRMMVAVGPR